MAWEQAIGSGLVVAAFVPLIVAGFRELRALDVAFIAPMLRIHVRSLRAGVQLLLRRAGLVASLVIQALSIPALFVGRSSEVGAPSLCVPPSECYFPGAIQKRR